MSDNERPMKESKAMNNFCRKILAKPPKFGNMARMAFEAKFIPFFNNYRHHGRHTQVHKRKQGME